MHNIAMVCIRILYCTALVGTTCVSNLLGGDCQNQIVGKDERMI
jgi:hypothetical protein